MTHVIWSQKHKSGLGSLTTKDEAEVFAKMNFGVF